MNDAFCYVRFSPKPDATDVQSLIVQEGHCRDYARGAALTVADVLADEEQSGRKKLARRPEGARLLELLASSNVKHVICYKLDRMFRNTIDGLSTLAKWDKAGIALHVATTGAALNSKSPEGLLCITFLLGVAQYEPMATSMRTRDSMKRQQADGRLMSDIPPYGWIEGPTKEIAGKTKRTLVEDAAEQVQIARMVRWQGQGVKLAEIARRLTHDGVPTKMQIGEWSRHSVRRILKRAQVAPDRMARTE